MQQRGRVRVYTVMDPDRGTEPNPASPNCILVGVLLPIYLAWSAGRLAVRAVPRGIQAIGRMAGRAIAAIARGLDALLAAVGQGVELFALGAARVAHRAIRPIQWTAEMFVVGLGAIAEWVRPILTGLIGSIASVGRAARAGLWTIARLVAQVVGRVVGPAVGLLFRATSGFISYFLDGLIAVLGTTEGIVTIVAVPVGHGAVIAVRSGRSALQRARRGLKATLRAIAVPLRMLARGLSVIGGRLAAVAALILRRACALVFLVFDRLRRSLTFFARLASRAATIVLEGLGSLAAVNRERADDSAEGHLEPPGSGRAATGDSAADSRARSGDDRPRGPIMGCDIHHRGREIYAIGPDGGQHCGVVARSLPVTCLPTDPRGVGHRRSPAPIAAAAAGGGHVLGRPSRTPGALGGASPPPSGGGAHPAIRCSSSRAGASRGRAHPGWSRTALGRRTAGGPW